MRESSVIAVIIVVVVIVLVLSAVVLTKSYEGQQIPWRANNAAAAERAVGAGAA